MKVKISEIERRVYTLLDENRELVDERVMYGDPETAIKSLIIDLLPDAARVVLCSIDASYIDDCIETGLKLEVSMDKIPFSPAEPDITIGNVSLKSDNLPGKIIKTEKPLLRLLYLRMSDWEYGVTQPLAVGSEEYTLRLPNPRRCWGRRVKPAVAVLHHRAEPVLQVFGTDSASFVDEIAYLTVPEVSGAYIDLPPGCVSAVCSKLAQMVGEIINK